MANIYNVESDIVEQFAEAGYQIIRVDICRLISMYSQ